MGSASRAGGNTGSAARRSMRPPRQPRAPNTLGLRGPVIRVSALPSQVRRERQRQGGKPDDHGPQQVEWTVDRKSALFEAPDRGCQAGSPRSTWPAKSQRHEITSSREPPINTPASGRNGDRRGPVADRGGAFSGGNKSVLIARAAGTSNAVPTAVTTRASSRGPSEGATAEAAMPTSEMAKPPTQTRLRPRTSEARPAAGVHSATTNMGPSVTQLVAAGAACRSRAM